MWVNAAHHAATIAAPMVPARGETRELGTVSRLSRDTRACGRASRSAREISFPFDSSPVGESARRAERSSRLVAVVVARDRRG